MADRDIILPTESMGAEPEVRTIGTADIKDALKRGLDDFRAMPTHVIFLTVIYPAIGLLIGFATVGYDLIPLLYPLASGFALIGPFAAIGLYELSRRREAGLDTTWSHAFDVVHSPSLPAIVALGLLLLGIFIVWVFAANTIYVANFGYVPQPSLTAFVHTVLTTPQGYNLIVVGNLVGFLFAVVAFSLSVVSFPLLFDRHVGFATAIATSLQAVLKNPVMMALWGLIIAGGLLIGSLPFFLGLAIVVPILGHASWHLYRKVVVPDPSRRPEFHKQEKGKRYAADFPSSLFTRYRGDKE
jgi:uncharacterized membrane protein